MLILLQLNNQESETCGKVHIQTVCCFSVLVAERCYGNLYTDSVHALSISLVIWGRGRLLRRSTGPGPVHPCLFRLLHHYNVWFDALVTIISSLKVQIRYIVSLAKMALSSVFKWTVRNCDLNIYIFCFLGDQRL